MANHLSTNIKRKEQEMQTGEKVGRDRIMMPKTNSGFGSPFVFECGTVLPSYGLGNGGVVDWEELPWRGGAIENAKNDGSVKPAITASGIDPCPKDGAWEILGTEIKVSLPIGDAFPEEYKDYIWTLREKAVTETEKVAENEVKDHNELSN